MLHAHFRALPLRSLVALILLVALAMGLVARPVAQGRRPPAEKAHVLAEEKNYAAAEDEYLELAARDPGNIPLLLDLLNNHESLRAHDAEVAKEEEEEKAKRQGPVPLRLPREDVAGRAARVDAFFMHLPPESALLAGYWHRALRGEATDEERHRVADAASTAPPTRWANHVLGLDALHEGDDARAATFFAREAHAFDASRADAELAYWIWVSRGDAGHLNEALDDAHFAGQLGPGVRFDIADRRGDWRRAILTFFRSQYAETTLGIVFLALLSAAVWFAFCLSIGGGRRSDRRFLFLYGAAFVLGIASTYSTVALMLLEYHFFPFLRSNHPGADLADCLIGVGPREEISKAVMVLVPLLIAKRWGGRRREALACGALVGLGFAAEENIGYFASGLSTALLRFLTANFFHISTTGMVAVAIDDTLRGTVSKGNGIGWTLAFMVVMHGLYDAFLGAGASKVSWVAALIFVLVARRFLGVLRELPGRRPSLLPIFAVGMALVIGASFVYASVLVGPRHAAGAMGGALVGAVVVIAMFVNDLEPAHA
jgi:protease PrsW